MQQALLAEETVAPTSWASFVERVFLWLQTSGLKLLIGLLALFFLFGVVNALSRRIRKNMLKHGRDLTLTTVLYNINRIGWKIILFLLFLGYVGIETAGIGTIIASFSVALGLALQGSLSNIAGWIVIIVMRPFKMGDFITAQGESGTVEEIKLFYTHITTTDNKVIMIPNGALANGNIINFSAKDVRRLDEVFSISYDNDPNLAIAAIEKVMAQNALILSEAENAKFTRFVRVSSCAASSIDITARCWVRREDYWTVHFALIENVKKAFDESGISVPYQQLDVHIKEK